MYLLPKGMVLAGYYGLCIYKPTETSKFSAFRKYSTVRNDIFLSFMSRMLRVYCTH